jgi:hypothetical protein
MEFFQSKNLATELVKLRHLGQENETLKTEVTRYIKQISEMQVTISELQLKLQGYENVFRK